MYYRHRGFTLVEMLVTVTIMAIAAAVAIPAIGSSQDSVRVPGAARQVMSDMLLAQSTAIMTQQPVYVFILKDSANNNCYTALTFASGVTPAAPSYTSASTATTANNQPGTNGSTGKYLISSLDKNPMFTIFGANRNPGALLSKVATVSGGASTNITSFGFDSLGQPIDTSKNVLFVPIQMQFTNSRGGFPVTLTINPISGEMSAQ